VSSDEPIVSYGARYQRDTLKLLGHSILKSSQFVLEKICFKFNFVTALVQYFGLMYNVYMDSRRNWSSVFGIELM